MEYGISDDSGTKKSNELPSLERESDVLRAAVVVIRDRLPESWRFDASMDAPSPVPGLDAMLRLRAPDGSELTVFVEAKRMLNTRDVPMAVEHLRRVATALSEPEAAFVLVARYLAPATRERIIQAGAGYIDATGNVYIASDRPALLLRDRGADRDPWRGPGRPRGTLKGLPAARVVRALIDFAPPYSVPEIAQRAGSSTGATYRVVEFLKDLGLVTREQRGPVTNVRWRSLIERWSRDYGFAQSNTVSMFLEPRGLSALTTRLVEQPQLEYVMTGSLAAHYAAPYAPARLAMLYVRNLSSAVELLELRPTTTGANVAIAIGDYDVVFERPQIIEGLRLAAVSQVAVDLLTGPGRNPNEASTLLDWMERNESTWRH